MFEHATITIKQQLSGFQDQYRIDVDLSYNIRVYAPEDKVWESVKEALREAIRISLPLSPISRSRISGASRSVTAPEICTTASEGSCSQGVNHDQNHI